MSKYSDAVTADNEREFKRLEASREWLKSAAWFDHNILLSDEKRAVAAKLFDELMKEKLIKHRYKPAQKFLDFEVLIANLLYHKRRKPVSVSMNRNDWRSNIKYTRASYFVMDLVTMLHKERFIKLVKGYGHEEKEKAVRTKIWPTERLLEAFAPIRMEDCVFSPVDLVNLREKETHRPLDYTDTRETRKIRHVLRRLNTITDRALVQFVNPQTKMAYRLSTRLHCVYTDDFKHGGRFYTANIDGYQTLENKRYKDRQHIHIDGRACVELDFSAMQPRLLYSWEREQYQGDPYVLDGDADLRPVFKVIFASLVNSEPKVSKKNGRLYSAEERALDAVNEFINNEEKGKYYRMIHKRGLNAKNDLIPMFIKAHPKIAKYFYFGAGLLLANQDSKIALRIIDDFVRDDIPILCIHDSFVVEHQYQDRLFQVMDKAYRDETKGFTCPIK